MVISGENDFKECPISIFKITTYLIYLLICFISAIRKKFFKGKQNKTKQNKSKAGSSQGNKVENTT